MQKQSGISIFMVCFPSRAMIVRRSIPRVILKYRSSSPSSTVTRLPGSEASHRGQFLKTFPRECWLYVSSCTEGVVTRSNEITVSWPYWRWFDSEESDGLRRTWSDVKTSPNKRPVTSFLRQSSTSYNARPVRLATLLYQWLMSISSS